ncbi:Alpha/Beta hydrolase protein [Mycena crocata]|nr:Alpha/Beta hydrolase protein [Mycena crocata]
MFLHSSLLLFAFSLLPDALGTPNTQGKSGPIINTTSGSYAGVNDAKNGVDAFKGIRYAAQPKRFEPALPFPKPPAGVQSAASFGMDCPQQDLSLSAVDGYALGPPLGGANQSEDCLFLNIWRPAAPKKNSKLPILVYFHGGGYVLGGGSEWNGTSLVRRSVATKKSFIYISVSYRLGVLGFLSSDQVPPSALNAGLLDQRAALRWIQDNAEAFGGDSSRVTISGESAGAGSVHMHYIYPDSKPTFRAGISSSGTSLVVNMRDCDYNGRPGGAYTVLGNSTGCGSGPGSFECLQGIPFDTFWPLAVATYSLGYPLWSPCKGPQGSLIEEYPVKKVIAGDFLKLPIITGTNENEGGLAIGGSLLAIQPPPPLDMENTILSGFIQAQSVKNVSQQTINQLLEMNAHPTDRLSNSTLYDRAVQFQTDYLFVAPQRVFLKSASAKQRKQNVWAYSFQQHLPGAPAFLGVFHSTDLYYLDMGFAQVPTSKLLLQMQDIYISFTNNLNPGIDWPKYDEEGKMVMRLADGRVGPIKDTLRRNQTDFLSQPDVMDQFGRFG